MAVVEAAVASTAAVVAVVSTVVVEAVAAITAALRLTAGAPVTAGVGRMAVTAAARTVIPAHLIAIPVPPIDIQALLVGPTTQSAAAPATAIAPAIAQA